MRCLLLPGVGASCGVLIKSAEALERAQALQAVVFDKTGTLTQGRPAVVAVRQADPQVCGHLGSTLPASNVIFSAYCESVGWEVAFRWVGRRAKGKHLPTR